MGFVLLVYGGRDFDDWRKLYALLDSLNPQPTKVIHGGAPGADTHGALWAKSKGIPTEAYPAQWNIFGQSAGPKRNQWMIEAGKPDMAVECPGGRGTTDMRARLIRSDIQIRFLEDEESYNGGSE